MFGTVGGNPQKHWGNMKTHRKAFSPTESLTRDTVPPKSTQHCGLRIETMLNLIFLLFYFNL